MKLIEKKDNKIIFVEKIGEPLANAIRRSINEILIPAIEEVEIFKNDSPLYDETIAHRLGLVPLKFDKPIPEKGVSLKLAAKGPGYVYSKDLKGGLKSVFDKIPLIYLDKEQEAEMVATVKLGKGIEHSKFSPGFIFYTNVPEIKTEKELTRAIAEEVVKACPQGALKIEGNKIILKDPYKCDMCEACIEKARNLGKERISIVPTDELIITIESFGQIDVKEIFNRAIKQLKNNLNEVTKKVSK